MPAELRCGRVRDSYPRFLDFEGILPWRARRGNGHARHGWRGVVAGDEGYGDSYKEDVGANVGDEPGVAGAGVSRGGAREHDVEHEGEDSEAVDGSGDKGKAVHELYLSAEGVVNGGYAEGDEEVQDYSQDSGGEASAEGFVSEQAAGYGVRDGDERGSILDGEENDGEREVEGSGGDAGDEDGFEEPCAGVWRGLHGWLPACCCYLRIKNLRTKILSVFVFWGGRSFRGPYGIAGEQPW